MIARLIAYDGGGIPEEFLRIYAQAPALFDTYVNQKQGDIGVVSLWSLTEDALQADITTSRNSTDKIGRNLAEAIDYLEETNPDALADITTPVADTAWLAGICLAIYAMTNGGRR
jgi:hypothetical protein